VTALRPVMSAYLADRVRTHDVHSRVAGQLAVIAARGAATS
jgi:hypothetical protein